MENDPTEDRPYQGIDHFNEKQITLLKLYLICLNEIHPFYDGNGHLCKIIFANKDKINQTYGWGKN